MTRLTVKGGAPLTGEVSVSGAKNAVLPILAASLMFEGNTTIYNIPNLGDVRMMIRMLNSLGLRTEYRENENFIRIWNSKKVRHIAPYELVTSMRASFFVAGPILAKTGFAKVPLPGGCCIGARPVDIHLKGFEEMGAKIRMEHGFVELSAKELVGAKIHLSFPSVGATENLMMAACLAKGKTVIENCAKEPEIDDLGKFLQAAGAKIEGLGTSTIEVTGVEKLTGVDSYNVIADRVEAATLLIAGAITGGEVKVNGIQPKYLTSLLDKLKEMGLNLKINKDSITINSKNGMKSVDIETLPFPGFPTDMQAQMMALLTVAPGKSIVKEKIFENRFMHARELMRMGADIQIDDHHAVISGVKNLSGAEVKITDLRAGAALILAGLVAEGETTVYGLKHLKRGYDNLPEKLISLGATIYEHGGH